MKNTSLSRTVLITGAGTGIGLASAEKFISEGWFVYALGRRIEPLKSLAERFPEQVLSLPCDLTNARQVALTIEQLEEAFNQNPLGALINNAGLYTKADFANSTDEHWQEQVEFNLLAPVRLTRLVVPILLKQNTGGSIVNISSTLGLRPVGPTSAYSAMKAAMVSWTKSLARELAPQGIRVNCICPGIVETPIHEGFIKKDETVNRALLDKMQPLGRIGQPEEIAHSIFHFCAPGSEWITGSIFSIDGGISL